MYCFYYSFGQKIAVAAERLNILYVGVDNPLAIAAENTPFDSLLVKATRGDVVKIDDKYIYRISDGIGPVDIIVYKRSGNKLQELGRTAFRVKRAGLPELKLKNIGSSASVDELLHVDSIYTKYQELNLSMPIEQFSIEIISCGTGKSVEKVFSGNKISEEAKNVFRTLKHGDILLIKGVITLFNEKGIEIEDRRILIK